MVMLLQRLLLPHVATTGQPAAGGQAKLHAGEVVEGAAGGQLLSADEQREADEKGELQNAAAALGRSGCVSAAAGRWGSSVELWPGNNRPEKVRRAITNPPPVSVCAAQQRNAR
jgi:hypothetical protein